MILFNKTRKTKKSASNFLHFLSKKLAYSKDLLSDRDLTAVEDMIQSATDLIKDRQKSADMLQKELSELELAALKVFRPDPRDSMREWVEVFLVAAVIAISFKTFFFQPFKIPTNSMFPTLYGVVPTSLPEDQLPKALPLRIWDTVVFGKSHHRVVAKEDGLVHSVEQGKWLGLPLPFFDVTRIRVGDRTYTVHTAKGHFDTGTSHSVVPLKTHVKAGQVIANFVTETGDNLFVNKMTYHFRKPSQGEVFVFTTNGIWGIESNNRRKGIRGGQFYIKRCTGVPGVELSLEEPYLFSNGDLLDNRPVFEKIYSRQNGYSGYAYGQTFLTEPGAILPVRADQYWAMGDNSAHSLDSRAWGTVPRKNLVGTGFFVYWPFTKRWGFIQ